MSHLRVEEPKAYSSVCIFKNATVLQAFSLLIVVSHGFELCIFSECLCPAPPFFVCSELHSNTGIKLARNLFKSFYSYWKLEGFPENPLLP